jgi:formylmethanofuran dehydrogenase subunit E
MKPVPQDLLQKAIEFHGHLGPYMVLGLRVGWLARSRLRAGPFEIRARIGCPAKPPGSCFIDGVQMGSGCTLGKANLERRTDADIWAHFEARDQELSYRVRAQGVEKLAEAFGGAEDVEALCREIASGRLDNLLFAAEG